MLLDDRGIIRYATPAAKFILGFEADDVVGKEIVGFVHPDDVRSPASGWRTRLPIPAKTCCPRFAVWRSMARFGSSN